MRQSLRNLLFVAMVCAPLMASASERWTGNQTALVDIGADGRVESAKLVRSTLSQAMQDDIVKRISRFEFEPARIDGRAVTAQTHLWIQLAIEPQGEQLAVTVADASVSLGYEKVVPPRFPPTQLERYEGASVMVEVNYDSDGKVTQAEVISAKPDLRVFRNAAQKAALEWVFAPEKIDGKGVAGSALVPVNFEFEGNHTGEINFPDGGRLHVRRADDTEPSAAPKEKLLASRVQLRSLGSEPQS